MAKNTTTLNITEAIAELTEVRSAKAELAKRESAIRAEVLEFTGKTACDIADPQTGEIIAEVVASERRSISDWDSFAINYPEAYEALTKFTNVLTLNLK
jgi:hypothetical protein